MWCSVAWRCILGALRRSLGHHHPRAPRITLWEMLQFRVASLCSWCHPSSWETRFCVCFATILKNQQRRQCSSPYYWFALVVWVSTDGLRGYKGTVKGNGSSWKYLDGIVCALSVWVFQLLWAVLSWWKERQKICRVNWEKFLLSLIVWKAVCIYTGDTHCINCCYSHHY